MSNFAKKQLLFVLIILLITLGANLLLTSNLENYFQRNFILVSTFGMVLCLLVLIFKNKKAVLVFVDYAKIAYATLALFNLVQTYFVLPVITDGDSMYPTLKDKDILISVVDNEYVVGDVVILNYENKLIVKRIIADAGDAFYYEDEELYINGKIVEENYLPVEHFTYDFDLSEVCYNDEIYLNCSNGIPDGYYLVLGDNREVSQDSRSFGLVHESDIYSKTVYNVSKMEKINE